MVSWIAKAKTAINKAGGVDRGVPIPKGESFKLGFLPRELFLKV